MYDRMIKDGSHPARRGTLLASALVVLGLLALSGCETGRVGPALSAEDRAGRLAANQEHDAAASAYIGLASAATGTERDRLTLLAVEQWLEAGDLSRARNAFAGVAEPSAGSELAWLWRTNRAGLALADGNADTALELLEGLSRQSLSLPARLRVEALRARAWFAKGEPGRAVELLVQREAWLDDARELERNRREVWQGLTSSSPASLRDAADSTGDPVVRGWLALGSLAAATGQRGIGWSNGVVRWRETHPDHPAMAIIGDLEFEETELASYPARIALLVPLSGSTAPAGKAIQNGFLGAYFASAGGLDDRQAIRIYDVESEGGASAAYATAVSDGAEFVVGPLLRNNVIELANDILVPVPVLTLNYLPENMLSPPGLYQFALAPEDEAVAAAERAIADGHQYALALIPNTSWGRRVFTSFATAFESLGGTVLDNRTYMGGTSDFSPTIEDLMALSGSVMRYQRLRANIGAPLQFDPRRRQDADFIFLAADADAGRLIKSQLRFHYSGELPVYATSSIYAMDGRSDADLNGVMFADAPWLIEPHTRTEHLPDVFATHWPEQRRLARLHAMGFDAYNLVGPLFASRGTLEREIDGATGRLYMDGDGRIHRRLPWAVFRSGEVVPLSPNTDDVQPGPAADLTGDAAWPGN